MKTFKQISLLLFVSILTPVQAQTNNPDLQRELNLEKEYSPSLRDANKLNRLPEIKEPEAPKTKVEFSNYTMNYTIPPFISRLNAPTYFPDFATSNKRGYLVAGVSSLLNIDGDLGYQLLNSDKNRLSIFASHRSSNSSVSYLQNFFQGEENLKMKINDNLGGFNYVYTSKQMKLFADAQYTHSAFNYYGNAYWNPETESNDQVNNMLQAHLGVSSVNNPTLTYKANIAYTLFKQDQSHFESYKGRTENRIMADADLYAHFNATGGIGVGGYIKNYSYNMPGHEALTEHSKSLWGNRNYTTLSFNPYVTFVGDNWNTRLGLTANIQTGGTNNFIPAPDVRFNWYPADVFRLYFLAEGGIKDNSNYDLHYENRYIDPKYRIYDSRSPFDGTLGICISPVSNLNIELFGGYKWVKDEHFYINESNNRRLMDYRVQRAHSIDQEIPIVNPGTTYMFRMNNYITPQYFNAEVFKLGGAIKYAYQDLFDFHLKGTYFNWNITKRSDLNVEVGSLAYSYKLVAWNKPCFIGDATVGFKIPVVPFRFEVNYHLESGRKTLADAYSYYGEVEKMKDIHDLNVKGTFALNETLSVFVKANNLLFQRYDIWYGYPAQKFNIMGGISLKF